jgi:hypothetical protein
LNGQGHRLEFDYNKGLYRMAYYFPDLDPISGNQVGEKRVSHKHAKLGDVLTVVLGEADAEFDPLTVEQFMREQPWGRELPR